MRNLSVFAVLALIVATQASFLPKVSLDLVDPEVPAPTLNGSKANAITYYNAIWGFYNLNETVADTCFTEVSAQYYFNFIGVNYQLFSAFVSANHTAVSIYSAQLEGLQALLNSTFTCIQQSQDLQNLLKATGGNDTNQTLYDILQDLYYQGHYPDWVSSWTPVNNALAAGNYYSAGTTYAAQLPTIVTNSTRHEGFFNGFKAFQNGIFYQANVTAPYQLSNCYDDETAKIGVWFYYFWSQAIQNATAATTYNATLAYFQGQGGLFYQQLEDMAPCFESTNDQTRINAKFGVDILGAKFNAAILDYIKANPQITFYQFTSMYGFFNKFNPLAAGIVYGQFLLQVAGSMNSVEI